MNKNIAVAIPCFNEAPALPHVIGEWLKHLPIAKIYLFDNNSTDHSAEVARNLGAIVIPVPAQGKGFVVQAMVEHLKKLDAVIMADGDGTYPASAINSLLQPVLSGQADMTVGARVPDQSLGAMSPVRSLGNILLRTAFFLLMGIKGGDILSGYRVFGPKFLNSVKLRSAGFEIETEIACQSVAHGIRIIEKPVPYLPRVAGTASKLRAFRDGLRILRTMTLQSLRLKPWRIGSASAIILVLFGLFTGSGLFWIFAGVILGFVFIRNQNLRPK